MTATLDGGLIRLEERARAFVAWVLPASPPIAFEIQDTLLVVTTAMGIERWGALRMPMLSDMSP